MRVFNCNVIKKAAKYILITVSALLLAYKVIFHIILFFMWSPMFMPSKEMLEKNFLQNRAELWVVVNYLDNQNSTFIYFTNTHDSKTTFTKDYKIGTIETNIEEQVVIDAIDYIMDNGKFSVISGNSDEFITFQKWATRDKDCGIVYSYYGKEPEIEFLTRLEPLCEDGWYYYISDFDKYRRRN